MRKPIALMLFLTPLLLGGCLARLAGDIVTAPIKVVSKTADVLTTSQSEADEKRGREVRKNEALLGKLSRDRDKAARNCAREPGSKACDRLESLNEEIARAN